MSTKVCSLSPSFQKARTIMETGFEENVMAELKTLNSKIDLQNTVIRQTPSISYLEAFYQIGCCGWFFLFFFFFSFSISAVQAICWMFVKIFAGCEEDGPSLSGPFWKLDTQN